MNAIKAAVLLRSLGLLDENQSRALDLARKADPVIRYLFRLFDPDSVDPSPSLIELAGKVAKELEMEREIEPRKLFQGDRGTLLYRDSVPMYMLADDEPLSVPPSELPLIHLDYAGRRLVIQQTLDRVPSGVVEVIVKRRRGEAEVVTFPPVRIQLEHVDSPKGESFWYADIDLNLLVGEFHPGDDFTYCVAVAPG
jgi:hypothetical protein